jgi:hypothetical protein
VSHVLQWNTITPAFNASSNFSCVKDTVWLWSFGHTISNSMLSLMSLRYLVMSRPMVTRAQDFPELIFNQAAIWQCLHKWRTNPRPGYSPVP